MRRGNCSVSGLAASRHTTPPWRRAPPRRWTASRCRASTAVTPVPISVSTPLSANAASITGRAESPISEPTLGLWSTSRTRGRTSAPNSRRHPVRQFARGLDTRQARADHHRGRSRRASSGRGEPVQVRIELHRAVVGVDVEAVLPQTRDVRLDHPAAGGQHQPVVAVGPAARRSPCARRVDGRHRGGDVADTDGVEHSTTAGCGRRSDRARSCAPGCRGRGAHSAR